MKKLFCWLTLIMMLAVFLSAPAQVQKGDFMTTYNESGSGTVRKIYMSVPSNYDSTISYPLLYAWHGSGMPGSDMRLFMQSVNTTIGAIICCPDVNGMTTSPQINEMITKSTQFYQKYNIDPGKRIITGFSMGGGYAYQIGLQNPSGYTGIIGLSPAIGSADFTTTMWNNITLIRMATILGTLDFNYSPVNSLMTQIKSQGGNLFYLKKTGVTHSDNLYFNSLEFKTDYQNCYNYVIGLTSIEDNQNINNLNMHVYPNPFTNEANVEINTVDNGQLTLQVLDMFGKKVYENINNPVNCNGQITLKVSNLEQGIYMLIIGDGIHTFSQKIIKQ